VIEKSFVWTKQSGNDPLKRTAMAEYADYLAIAFQVAFGYNDFILNK